jgi:hypothetical protein
MLPAEHRFGALQGSLTRCAVANTPASITGIAVRRWRGVSKIRSKIDSLYAYRAESKLGGKAEALIP